MRLALVAVLLLCAGSLSAAAPAAPKREETLRADVRSRDGVRLSTLVFKPAGAGRFPAILLRTPYNKDREKIENYRSWLGRGYAVVLQDVRGRNASGGRFTGVLAERYDGDDTLNWIAAQPWSNGRVGMIGGSYPGMTQWQAALSGNPHLVTIFPGTAGFDEYLDRFYSRGGAFRLGHRLGWISDNIRAPGFQPPPFDKYVRHVPLRTADRRASGMGVDFYQAALDHPAYDSYWRSQSVRQQIDRLRIPAHLVAGWYDPYVQSDLELFQELTTRGVPARIVVGPWAHNMQANFPGFSFGANASAGLGKVQAAWFDHWMKNAAPKPDPPPGPPARLFVMGRNQWREESEWPPAGVRYTPWYLSSDRGLQPEPRSKEPVATFTYDPRNPVPTRGGQTCCNVRVQSWGPADQRLVELRPDVLTFTSPPLEHDLEVIGPVRALLWVSTSAPDTDFTAKLIDVEPGGVARNLTDGILRLRYRQSLERPVLAKPGEIYPIEIDLGVTANTFLAGHRLRVEISSSNFPRFDRNPNTGAGIADETRMMPAQQTIHLGRAWPSHILLPVAPPPFPGQ